MIAEPLTSMQCCPVGDGAAAAVLCRKELLKKYSTRPAVTVASSVLKSEMYEPGHVFIGPVVGPMSITINAGREAYEKAGIAPEDLDIVEVHDAFTIEELVYYESLGIAKPGEGDKLVQEGTTELGGKIPFSVSGGLIGRGHPGGPTGLAQIHEITLQLRGDAGDRQVKDAKVGLAHMVGGGSVCVVSILKR
jgi:acetyl-CoA acetyltransferase